MSNVHQRELTHLFSSSGTPPESLFDERSTSIGLWSDKAPKKSLGMVPTRSLSGEVTAKGSDGRY